MEQIINFLTGDFLSLYLPTILSLAVIEVLLSIDNALVNASIAEPLPSKERRLALMIGIAGGAVLRLVALLFAVYIIQNKWILVLGGLYLMYLAVDHLFIKGDAGSNKHVSAGKFWPIVAQIIIADGVFSIDNVISAVGISHQYYVVVTGVLFGVVSMLFVTQLVSGIVHRHPPLKKAAYVIVGLIGMVLILESFTSLHVGEVEKFIVIMSVLFTSYVYSHRKNKKLQKVL